MASLVVITNLDGEPLHALLNGVDIPDLVEATIQAQPGKPLTTTFVVLLDAFSTEPEPPGGLPRT